jgi:hypothetical protein
MTKSGKSKGRDVAPISRERRNADCYISVIALSKLYALNDSRLAQIQVKGDLIVGADDGKIKTRSRAKQSMYIVSDFSSLKFSSDHASRIAAHS